MKIDLVYLWVDGSDEKWLARKNAVLAKNGRPLARSSVSANRWNDNDELKNSLRSASKFAPWINHIFIVTDNQVPAWLDTKNKKITIVDHTDIIPQDLLPTYNSGMIELFLQKIPGLSEHFLFANDDFFFGHPVVPDFFFDDMGNPIVIAKEKSMARAFSSRPESDIQKSRLFQRMVRNSARFVYQNTKKKYNITMKHAIEPMRKSYLSDNINSCYDELIKTTATQFRDVTNLQRIVFPMLDNACGRNTIVLNWGYGNMRIKYDVNRDSMLRRIWHFLMWIGLTMTGKIRYDLCDVQFNLIRKIKKYKPKMFCINDLSGDKKNILKMNEFMAETFKEKSSFEK